MSDNESRKLFIALLVLAAVARLVVIFAGFSDYRPTDDARHWHIIAQNFLNGKGLILDEQRVAYRTPMPGLYFAAIYSLFGVSTRAVQISNVLLGVITVGLVYSFVKSSFGIESARWAAVFVSAYPTLLLYTAQLLSETLVIMFLMLAVWSVWFLRDRRAGWFAPVGVVLGLAVLTRQTVLPIAVSIALWSLVAHSADRGLRRILPSLIIVTFLALTITPWTVRNYRITGRFIPLTSEGGTSLWIANNPLADGTGEEKVLQVPHIQALPEGERGSAYQKLAVQFIRENPAQFVRLMVRRFFYFWHLGYHGEGFGEVVFLMIYLPTLGLAALGTWVGWCSNRDATLLLLLVPISLTAVHMVFLPVGRYRLPAELTICMLAGIGASWSWGQLRGVSLLRHMPTIVGKSAS